MPEREAVHVVGILWSHGYPGQTSRSWPRGPLETPAWRVSAAIETCIFIDAQLLQCAPNGAAFTDHWKLKLVKVMCFWHWAPQAHIPLCYKAHISCQQVCRCNFKVLVLPMLLPGWGTFKTACLKNNQSTWEDPLICDGGVSNCLSLPQFLLKHMKLCIEGKFH